MNIHFDNISASSRPLTDMFRSLMVCAPMRRASNRRGLAVVDGEDLWDRYPIPERTASHNSNGGDQGRPLDPHIPSVNDESRRLQGHWQKDDKKKDKRDRIEAWIKDVAVQREWDVPRSTDVLNGSEAPARSAQHLYRSFSTPCHKRAPELTTDEADLLRAPRLGHVEWTMDE